MLFSSCPLTDISQEISVYLVPSILDAAFNIEGETQHVLFKHEVLPNNPHIYELVY